MCKRMMDELHTTMRGLHTAGAIDKQTLRDFKLRALPPSSFAAEAIRALRERLLQALARRDS